VLRIRAAAGLVAALLLLSSGGSGIPAVPMRLVMEVVYGTHLPGLANLRRALPSSSSSVSSSPRESGAALSAGDPRQGLAWLG
jgi:hypothetical protein